MSAHHKRLRNCYIWLMNMMSNYNDCKQEKNLVYIDFRMHVHLRWQQLKRWRQTFDVDESIWMEYCDHPDKPGKTMPLWFLWVSKWFMHGLNGPFGSLSEIPSIFLPQPHDQEKVVLNFTRLRTYAQMIKALNLPKTMAGIVEYTVNSSFLI